MRGGKPPDTTTVIDRAMNIIPKVVMNEGMSNLIVIQPLINPIKAQRAKPNKIASQKGTPATTNTAIVIGISAKTDPTDRSNSPQIISRVTPTATKAVSGKRPITPRTLSIDKKTAPDRIWKNTINSTNSKVLASSGFCKASLKRRFIRRGSFG